MVVQIGHVRVKPEQVELYETTFSRLREQVKAREPFVLFYELCRDPNVANGYVMFEAYVDKASQTLHVSTDYYQAASSVIVGCIEGVNLEEIARSGRTQPGEIYPLIENLVLTEYQPI